MPQLLLCFVLFSLLEYLYKSREFIVNLSLYHLNSLNFYKSHFSILTTTTSFLTSGLSPRLSNPKVMYQPVVRQAESCRSFTAMQSCQWFLALPCQRTHWQVRGGGHSPHPSIHARPQEQVSKQHGKEDWGCCGPSMKPVCAQSDPEVRPWDSLVQRHHSCFAWL